MAPRELDYGRLREALRRRGQGQTARPRAGANPERVAELKASLYGDSDGGDGGGGRSLISQAVDTALDVGKGVVTGLPNAVWDSVVGNVAGTAAHIGGLSAEGVRERGGILGSVQRAVLNEDLMQAAEEGASIPTLFAEAAPVLGEPARSLRDFGGRLKEVGEVAVTDNGWEDTQYAQANRDSQIVPLVFEDLGNVLLAVMGAGGAAGAAKGAAVGARAGGARSAVSGARQGMRAELTGTGPAARARRVDDAIGRAILSPLRSPTIASRVATGEGSLLQPVQRYNTGKNVRQALGSTKYGQQMANSRLGQWYFSKLLGSNPDVAQVRDEIDRGNKVNAVRRGEEALGPAQQVYDILSGKTRGLPRRQRRSTVDVENMEAAAILDMATEASTVLPVAQLDELRRVDNDAYTTVVERLGEHYAAELTPAAMDTFIDYKMGRLPTEVADDIAAAQQVWRDQALYSDTTRNVLGQDVGIGAERNFLEGTGRPADEKARGRAWRERSLEPEVLPNNIDPILRRAQRGRKALERGVDRAQGDVERLGARRRVSDEALADPARYSERLFGQATAEARRLVQTNPDVVADVQARFARPLSQDALVRQVRNDILDRRRQIDGLDSVPATPLFQSAATLDRPLFMPRRAEGLVREAGKEAVARRARRSERWNTGRMEQNRARVEEIRANRAPVSASKRALNRVASAARQQVRAQERLKKSQRALAKTEEKLRSVQPGERAAIRNAIRGFRRELRAQLEADRDAVVRTLTDELEARTGGDSIVVRSLDEVEAIEAALREVGESQDWRKFQFPGTTKRVFRVDLTPAGQGRIAGAVAADRLNLDVGSLVSEVLVPLREAKGTSFAGIVDDGIDVGRSWLAATEEEAAMLVGPLDGAVDAWVQAEGNPAAAAREDAMWDEAVERMQQVYALRAAGEPIRAAFAEAPPEVRRAMHAMLAEEASRAADDTLATRIDDTAERVGESAAGVGRRQGMAEGIAEGRAREAGANAAREGRVAGSRVLPEMEAQASARLGGSAVRQAAPELRLAGQQQRALRDLGRAERKLATFDARVERAVQTAMETITSAPARFRQPVELGRTAKRVLDEFEWDEYNVPLPLQRQLQAGVLTTVADVITKTDPDQFRGGPATLLSREQNLSPSQGGSAKKVQAARLKGTGKVPLSFTRQAALALRDIRQQTTNETMFAVADEIGKSPSQVKQEYAAKYGEDVAERTSVLEMATDLYGGEWVGWNPMSLFPAVHDAGPGAKRQAKFIDETGEDAMVLAPKWVPEAFRYAASQDNALAQALIDKPTRVFKGAVLALSPRWMVGNIVSGAIMLHAADVTVADIARHMRSSFRELRKMGKGEASDIMPRWAVDTGLTANEMALLQRLEVAAIDDLDFDEVNLDGRRKGPVRRAGSAVIRTGYGLNTFVDNWYKSIAAMTKAEEMGWKGEGALPTDAVKEALDIMGDYDRMTTFERRVLRRAFPFYAWVRHITKLTHKVAVDDPARVLWNIHLANVFAPEDEMWEQVPWLRGAVQVDDEFLNIGWLFPFDTTAQMDLSNPAAIFGANLNPVIGTAIGLTTGIDTSFGDFEPLSRPGVRFGGTPERPPLFSDPLGSAYLVGRNLPQFRGVWNEAQRRLNDGEALRQFDTGQVRPGEEDPNRTGTNNAATILNLPLPRRYNVASNR